MSWDSYFDETSPNQYRFLGFYKHRQNQQNFTFTFRKEADILRKSLDLLIKDNRSEDIKKGATRLIQGFEKHRFHNEDVNNFWNEIELMYNNKEKQRLESERAMRTKRCHVNISSKTQDMMENMAEETVEAHLAITKKKSTRKRKSISYTESSEEEDHSSDPDYTEKLKRKQEPRSKRSRGKTSFDDTDKGVIDPSVETSEIPSPGDTSHEITPSTSIKNTISKQYVREEYYCSRESTPCPTTHNFTDPFIITPNKPVITKSSCNQYSTHIICAFGSALHLVKETTEKELYEEIEKILKMRNKSVLNNSIGKKLEVILHSDYSAITSKLIAETKVEDDDITEDARFLFFIRQALLDFIAMFKFLSPKVISRDMSERSYIVECLSPVLRAFRNSFPDIKYEWIEKDIRSIKYANNIFLSDIRPRKADLLILRLSDATEILDIEVSGPPFNSNKQHTIGDAKKLLLVSVCGLCRILANNFDCSIKDAKRVRTYCIQAIGDRLTLFATSLIDKKKYLAIELASCLIPFSFDAISCYARIFNFFAVIRKEFVEQEEIQKKIRSFIPSADNNNGEDLREWIHKPDDDLAIVTEDDMDEIFL